MSDPVSHLDSLEIRGFRAISKLVLPVLGRVNLFVGKNNVGKTSLLEAIRLYVSRTPHAAFTAIARERGEPRRTFSRARPRAEFSQPTDLSEEIEIALRGLQNLFHGSFSDSSLEPIQVGPEGLKGKGLTIRAPWAGGGSDLWPPDELGASEMFLAGDSPILEFEHEGRRWTIPVDSVLRGVAVLVGRQRSGGTTFIPAGGLDSQRIGYLWDDATVLGYSTAVEDALRLIVPELERVHLVGDPGTNARSVSIQLRGRSRPVPIRAMGDGLLRVFGMALSIARASGGVVLIDEAESGLHYSIQEGVWRMILEFAERFDTQVFATTHSADTIQAFTAAAASRPDVDALMHRLEARGTELRVVDFTERDLELVTQHDIEVR